MRRHASLAAAFPDPNRGIAVDVLRFALIQLGQHVGGCHHQRVVRLIAGKADAGFWNGIRRCAASCTFDGDVLDLFCEARYGGWGDRGIGVNTGSQQGGAVLFIGIETFC